MKTLVKQEATVLKKKSICSRIASQWELYVFLLPAMIFLFVFAYGPMYGLLLAFKNYLPMKGIWGSPWVGFEHFIRFFTFKFTDSFIRAIHYSNVESRVIISI